MNPISFWNYVTNIFLEAIIRTVGAYEVKTES